MAINEKSSSWDLAAGPGARIIRSFLRALDAYPLDTPLAKFLPGYFRQNKQMGSSDRRTTSRLLYNYFRLGRACAQLPPEERVVIADFLCQAESSAVVAHVLPELNQHISLPLGDKIAWLEKQNYGFRLTDVFPFTQHLSAGVNLEEFLASGFIQPDLFIRVYPGKADLVKAKLTAQNIFFSIEEEVTFRLPNGTKLDQIFGDDMPFEIQDRSSQQTGNFFAPHQYDYWWDACAASGGKSILLYNQQPTVKLLVSDIRESVLTNLDERFTKAGIRSYHKKVLDLMQNVEPELHHYEFDGIVLDAPCTGSGTWGRTPEMISQFEEHRINFFQQLQKTIAVNVLKYLKPGKPLIYITCSVFKGENEDVINYLVKEHGLKVERSELITGYNTKADTMFVARLFAEH